MLANKRILKQALAWMLSLCVLLSTGVVVSAYTVTNGGVEVSTDSSSSQDDYTVDSDGSCEVSYVLAQGNASYGKIKVESKTDWITVGTGFGSYTESVETTGAGNDLYAYLKFGENPNLSKRYGYVQVTWSDAAFGSGVTKFVWFTQSGGTISTPAASNLDVDTTSITVDADGTGSESSVYVSSDGNGYTVSTTDDWITFSRYSYSSSSASSTLTSYYGNGSFYVYFKENEKTSERTGTITVTHFDGVTKKTISVTQSAAATGEISLNPSSIQVGSTGVASTSSVYVTTNRGGYTVSTTDDWITFSRYSYSSYSASSTYTSSYGNSYFYVYFKENEKTSARTGTITVTHSDGVTKKTISVEQEAGASHEITVDTSTITVAKDGKSSTSSLYVTTDKGGYTVSTQNDWIKFAQSSYGYKSKTQTFSSYGYFYVFFDKNTEGTERKGTITVTHSDGVTKKTIDVVQAAAKSELEVETSSITVEANGTGSTSSVYVTTDVGGYTVSSESSWITFGRSTSASYKINPLKVGENASFYVFFDKNTEASERKGTITVTHPDGTTKKTIDVKQSAAAQSVLKPNVSTIKVNASGTSSTKSVTVDTKGTGGFTAKTDSNGWVKIGQYSGSGYEVSFTSSYYSSYSNSYTFYVSFEKNNTGSKRTQDITLTHKDGKTVTKITVEQDAMEGELVVGTEKKAIDQSGSMDNNYITVNTNSTGGCTVKVTEGADWLRVSNSSVYRFSDGFTEVKISSGYSTGFYLVAKENDTKAARTGKITVTHDVGTPVRTVNVTQAKADNNFQVLVDSWEFDLPDAAYSKAIKVSASSKVKWTVSTDKDWLSVQSNTYSTGHSNLTGTGEGSFYIRVDKNTSTEKDREGYVTVSAAGFEDIKIPVSQVRAQISDEDLLNLVYVTLSNKTFDQGKTSKIRLNYPEGLYASDIKSIKYKTSKKTVATISKKGTITGLKKGKANITVKLTLNSGSSRTFHLKVTIDKRKVKVKVV